METIADWSDILIRTGNIAMKALWVETRFKRQSYEETLNDKKLFGVAIHESAVGEERIYGGDSFSTSASSDDTFSTPKLT